MQRTINGLNVFLNGDENKTPIIFLHGFPFDYYMWDEQVKEFSRDYYCVRYDIRGLGSSTAGDGLYTMEMFVDDLEIIIQELKLNKTILCGLSIGGYISLRAVERMQEKFSAAILCDTKSAADDNEGKLKRAAAIKQINSGELGTFVESFVLNCFGKNFIEKKNSEFKKIVNLSKTYSPLGIKGCLLAMAGRTDTTGSLNKISLPTLLICGSEDKLSPPEAMKPMSDQIYKSIFVLIEDAGHMTPIENPKLVNKSIRDFLAQNKM